MANDLLGNFKNDISEVIIIPSSGGVFEVEINNQIVFSKKELNRFPHSGEILEKIR